MQTVCELKSFEQAAKRSGLSRDEIAEIVDFLAATPDSGDEIQFTGGCRKFRFAGKGRGKSGGYRIVTFFSGPDIPVFLITVFAKGEKANLTRAEANKLSSLTDILKKTYRPQRRTKGEHDDETGI